MQTFAQFMHRQPATGRWQAGGLTIFTGVFVLILMTLMLLYATRVGLFEQRVSSNETRQKLAFHVAETGMDYALEFLLAANSRILSASPNAQPDGAGNDPPTFRPGWFAPGSIRWVACPDTPGPNHPCGGDIPAGGTGSFYYDDPATTTPNSFDTLPLDTGLLANLPPNTELRVNAVLCPRTLDSITCLGATGVPDPTDPDAEAPKFLVWLLAYGYSDCNDDDASGGIDIPDECRGRAHVTQPLGNFKNFKGSPTVPLVSKNTLPTSGTAEVVPNPNGGGVGVPLSIWANSQTGVCGPIDPDGGPGADIEVQGSFKTCELHEWYGVDERPADALCDQPTCQCEYPGPEPISYRAGGDEFIGIDVLPDDGFPCDLFEFYFGYPRAEYQAVKANAIVIDDCSILNTGTPSGFYWFSGDTCVLDDVGTINNPILLISAADNITRINGNTSFFGTLYLANVEDPELDASFQPGGGATAYGAVIVDVLFNQSGFAGTFRVVYTEGALAKGGGAGGLGGLAGGWRDFGLPQIVWEP